jgi:PKD repeat protein
VAVTAEMVWNVTKYFTVNPNCWFDSITYESVDSPNDGDNYNDSINATISIKTCMPHDMIMVKAKLFKGDHLVETQTINYTINSSGTTDVITLTVPPTQPITDYCAILYLYNSTGRINDIVGLSGLHYNESNTSNYYPLYPRGNNKPNTPDQPSGSTDAHLWEECSYMVNGTADPNNDLVRYKWDWGDGRQSLWSDRLYGPSVSVIKWHKWRETGNFDVKVKAKDEWGMEGNWSDPLTVGVSFWADGEVGQSQNTIVQGDVASFSGDAVGGDDPYTWFWTLGDGNSSEDQNTTHIYNTTTNYTVNLNVTDNNGSYYNVTINISVVILKADFTTTPPIDAQPNQTIYFNDTSAGFYNNITNWTWNFGDGNISYDRNVSYVYSAEGAYNVSLTVTDNQSNIDVYNRTIHIDSVSPLITTVCNTESPVGFGSSVAIEAVVSDNQTGTDSGIQSVCVNVTYPDNSSGNYTMWHYPDNTAEYFFSDTWQVGQYNYTIWAVDNANNSNSSSRYSFNVSANTTLTVCTIKNSYGDNETVNLTDPPGGDPENPSGQTITGDSVVWENSYAHLEVYPHTSHNLIRQTQYANVTWKKPDTNIDVAFRFDNKLIDADIWMWQNISHNITVYDYGNITTSYRLYNITDFTILSETPPSVDFGDIPSQHYASGNATWWGGAWEGDWRTEYLIIGFDNYSWTNPEQTNATFNYTFWGIIGKHIEQQYWFDWNSQKDKFSYTTDYGRHDYFVTNIPVIQNQTYRFKWQYNVPPNSNGKWELLGKLNSDTVQEAFSTGRYVMIDPWWNSSWYYARSLTINSTYLDTPLTEFPVLVVINSTISSKCDGGKSIRFVNTTNETEFDYEVEKNWSTTGNNYVWVNISEQISSASDYVFYMYYNNSEASDNQDSNHTWNSNYVMVYHMYEHNATYIVDNTSNRFPGRIDYYPDEVTGQIGTAMDFNGSSSNHDMIYITESETYIGNNSYTIECWINPEAWTGSWDAYINCVDTSNYANYRLAVDDADPKHARFVLRKTGGPLGSDSTVLSTTTIGTGSWYYVVGTYDSSNQRIYVNDGGCECIDTGITAREGTYKQTLLGAYQEVDNNYNFNGTLDCVRLSDVCRNNTWINATYHTTNQTDGFLSWGCEQHLNYPPEISNPYPADGCTNVTISPALNITVSDFDGDTVNITWYHNATAVVNQTLVLRPMDNGSITELGKSGASYNWQCVDEGTADGDTTRVYTSYISFKTDVYNLSNHTKESGTINFVNVFFRVEDGTDARATIVVNNTEYHGDTISPPALYTTYNHSWSTNPNTSAAWTWDDIDCLEAGVSLKGGKLNVCKCTQVYVEVNYTGPSWAVFGTNSSSPDGNGTYSPVSQVFSNASVNGQWWYWMVNATDGIVVNESDVFSFYTGVQSKIENTGSTDVSGYLLIQVQYYNTSNSTWVVANDTVNETTTRRINASDQLGLDTVFNPYMVNTSDLLSAFGNGTYRIYAAFRDPNGNVLLCDDSTKLEATWEFEITPI